MKEKQIEHKVIGEVHKILETNSFKSLCDTVSTKYCFEKFVKTNFKWVKMRSLKVHGVQVGHYLSIKATITNELEDPTFQYIFEKSADPSVIKFARDTQLFKNSIFLNNNPQALTINLYSDVVSLTNPLGASKKKHNILHVYFTIN